MSGLDLRRLGASAVLSIAGSAFLLLAGSLFPVRLDDRAFAEWRRVEGLELPRATPYLYVSERADVPQRHFDEFVLPGLAFPSRAYAWIAPAENIAAGDLATSVFADGTLRPAGVAASPQGGRSDALGEFVRSGFVLYDSEKAREVMLARLPALAAARSVVLRPVPAAPVVWRSPRSMFTLRRLLRLASILGTAIGLAGWMRSRAPSGLPTLAAAAAAPCLAAALLVWLFSWSAWTPFPSPGPWPYLAWGLASLAWAASGRRADRGMGRRETAALALILVAFVAQYLGSLDFDEDTQSHWMIMARGYSATGRHVPENFPNHLLAAIYPSGFASLLAASAWAADTPADGFMRPNPPTHLAIFVYRTGVAMLHAGFLVLVGTALFAASGGNVLFATAGALVVAAWFPLLRGSPHAAETFLFPLLGAGMLLFALGRRYRSWMLIAAGFVAGGAAAFVKLEGALLFGVAVLPWLAGAASSVWRTRPVRTLGVAVAAFLPVGLWKWRLGVADALYSRPSIAGLLARRGAIVPVYSHCAVWLFRNGWIALLLGLVPAALWVSRRREAISSPLVPIGTLAAMAGLPLIYVFSNLPRDWQIDTSFSRLMLVPVLGALLFVLDRLGAGGMTVATRQVGVEADREPR